MEPFRTRDGRLVVGQQCSCGHALASHAEPPASQLPDLPNHGPCLGPGCPCRRFSLRHLIYAEEE